MRKRYIYKIMVDFFGPTLNGKEKDCAVFVFKTHKPKSRYSRRSNKSIKVRVISEYSGENSIHRIGMGNKSTPYDSTLFRQHFFKYARRIYEKDAFLEII